jgi:hypothetical protein
MRDLLWRLDALEQDDRWRCPVCTNRNYYHAMPLLDAFIALARAALDLHTAPESESQALDQIRALDAALDHLAAVLGTEGDDGA